MQYDFLRNKVDYGRNSIINKDHRGFSPFGMKDAVSSCKMALKNPGPGYMVFENKYYQLPMLETSNRYIIDMGEKNFDDKVNYFF